MAIRVRTVELPTGERALVAICAARSVEKPGDLYLDDGVHAALANKFHRDYGEESVPGVYEDRAFAEQEESNNPARAWWDQEYATPALPPAPARRRPPVERPEPYASDLVGGVHEPAWFWIVLVMIVGLAVLVAISGGIR